MMPAHSVPVLQRDGSILRGACWCEPVVIFIRATSDDGEEYVFPHTHHHYPLWAEHFCSVSSEDDDLRGPPC